MFTTTKIHELSSIASSSLSLDDELVLYNNTTQTTGKVTLQDVSNLTIGQIQNTLDQVGENTSNISTLNSNLTQLSTVQTLTVTVGSGFTGTVQAYKIGHLVMVLYLGDVGSMTAWKDIVICDLPSNIKAITDCYSVSMSNEGKPLVVEIYKNGTSVVARSLAQTHGGQLRGTLWVLTN